MLRGGPILVKDAFGVSGRGNVTVRSPERLQTLCRIVRAEEARSKRVQLVVEPLLDKVADFSAHFCIGPRGDAEFLGFMTMINTGASYLGSRPLERRASATLATDAGYQAVVEAVLGDLAAEGYFGPVCIDSLILADSTVYPVVEVNARMSMGLLSLRLGRKVAERGQCATVLKLPLAPRGTEKSVLEMLQANKLLAADDGAPGIVPLTSSAAAPGARTVIVALLHRTHDEELAVADALEAAVTEFGSPPALARRLSDVLRPHPTAPSITPNIYHPQTRTAHAPGVGNA